jgi:hypothetical protein
MGTKERVGKAVQKAARILPGIGSYQDKESLRETDKRLRDTLSAQLADHMNTIERLKTGIARKGSLLSLKDLDDLSRHFDKVSRSLGFASRGYAAIFDSHQVDEEALTRLFEFDQSLKKEVDLLDPLVSMLSEKGKKLDTTILDEARDLLLKIEKRINEREGLLKH